MQNIKMERFTGDAAMPYIEDLARLRVEVFRDFPYLYDGNLLYEQDYVQTYIKATDSVLVIAFDGDNVIGVSTALPMENEPINIQKPFLDKGFDTSKIFYFGESVLKKDYRGQGIGVEFFNQREAQARKLDRFQYLTFCGVVRPFGHPLRPENYIPLDDFWRKRGFQPTDLYCYMVWKDMDEEKDTPKPLRFWIKEL